MERRLDGEPLRESAVRRRAVAMSSTPCSDTPARSARMMLSTMLCSPQRPSRRSCAMRPRPCATASRGLPISTLAPPTTISPLRTPCPAPNMRHRGFRAARAEQAEEPHDLAACRSRDRARRRSGRASRRRRERTVRFTASAAAPRRAGGLSTWSESALPIISATTSRRGSSRRCGDRRRSGRRA